MEWMEHRAGHKVKLMGLRGDILSPGSDHIDVALESRAFAAV